MNGAKITFENWHVVVQMIAFFIIFTAFVYFSIRTLLMKKDKEDKLASMALDEENVRPESDVEAPKDKKL